MPPLLRLLFFRISIILHILRFFRCFLQFYQSSGRRPRSWPRMVRLFICVPNGYDPEKIGKCISWKTPVVLMDKFVQHTRFRVFHHTSAVQKQPPPCPKVLSLHLWAKKNLSLYHFPSTCAILLMQNVSILIEFRKAAQPSIETSMSASLNCGGYYA